MKPFILCFSICILLWGCVKSGHSTDPQPDPGPVISLKDSLASSFRSYDQDGNLIQFDTLRFDTVHAMASITVETITGTGPAQWVDSGTYYFTCGPVSGLPVSYRLSFRKYFYPADMIEEHTLTYDAQNRVLLDSMVSNSFDGYNPTGSHFIYGENVLIQHLYRQSENDYTELDSFLLVNNNLSAYSQNAFNGTNWYNSYTAQKTAYPGNTNPFYNAGMVSTIGCFMIFATSLDFISKDITLNQSNDRQYTWTKDARGRVVSGLGDDGSRIVYTY
jgi:hypothetical protein